jgi:hypothetical protein
MPVHLKFFNRIEREESFPDSFCEARITDTKNKVTIQKENQYP